jgi:hypothetical protein
MPRENSPNLENLPPDLTWKVRMIEEEFKQIMFHVQDVWEKDSWQCFGE